MKKITSISELREAALLLEVKQASDAKLLKEQLILIHENLKPANLLRNIFNELTTLPDFKEGIVNTSLGLGVSYLARKVIIGKTHNPIKYLLGTLLQMGVRTVISKNAEQIKSAGFDFMKRFLNHKKEKVASL